MAIGFNVHHVGNIGTLRIRYEDLQVVDDGKGHKIKKWVTVPVSAAVKAHESLDVFVGGNRRAVVEEMPT